jgi:hypothetical protein
MDPRTILQLAHILILGPLLIVIGKNLIDIPSTVIAGLGAFILLYHLYKATTAGPRLWINLIHILAVGPALLAKGLLSPTPRYVDEFLFMFGLTAIAYHGYYLTANLV